MSDPSLGELGRRMVDAEAEIKARPTYKDLDEKFQRRDDKIQDLRDDHTELRADLKSARRFIITTAVAVAGLIIGAISAWNSLTPGGPS